MAASMMMAPVGGRLKVSGISSAVPAEGPRPGNTPTRVPMTQPMKANMRFCGVRATEKPMIRSLRYSIVVLLEAQAVEKADGSRRQRHLQVMREQVIHTEAADQRHRQRDQQTLPSQRH